MIDSEQAPVLESSSLLRRSLNQKLKKNQNSNNGVNKTSTVRNAKTFKNSNNEQFVISSIQEGSNDYVDIMRGQSGNGNSNNVGSLKKTQRIVVNSKRKNFLSMGKLKNSSVLSISSTRGTDMKLYRLNSEIQVYNFIINISLF